MVHAFSVELLYLYLFCRVYQSLESGMWSNSSSTFFVFGLFLRGEYDNKYYY